MTRSSGYSVRIFIPSGEPEALRIVETSNWTGQGLVRDSATMWLIFSQSLARHASMLARHVAARLRTALGGRPVVLLHGARQTGKRAKQVRP